MLKINSQSPPLTPPKLTTEERRQRSAARKALHNLIDTYAEINRQFRDLEAQRKELQSALHSVREQNPGLLLRSKRYLITFATTWVAAYRVPADLAQNGFSRTSINVTPIDTTPEEKQP